MRRGFTIGVVAALVAASGLGAVASAAPGASGDRWSGQAAIEHLGGRLPSAAAEHGLTVAELRRQFTDDDALFIDATDQLFYVEPVEADAAPVGSDAIYDGAIADADALLLHSKPGAARVLYLDFDGHQLSGTAWNNSTAGACYAEPYTLDTNTAFSSSELGVIESVWKRVAEDYAPFDIDVTTQDPGLAAINRASTSDSQFGTRALITNSKTACSNGKTLYASVCPNGCGGVAYVGVFDSIASDHDYYQPALVFQNGVNSAKSIAEATSHEVGHNLGLSHDGVAAHDGLAAVGYYTGQGSWAPIMGVGYYEAITQWSKGEYAFASQLQDDFAVMGINGLTVRADDHGNTAATATAIVGSSFGIDGVIATRDDVDVFTVAAGSGTATFTVAPAPTSPNLDVRLEVRDINGVVVASTNPASGSTSSDAATGLGASISVSLAGGSYSVYVDGTGEGDPAVTGYSDYASVGHFRLTGTMTGPDGQAPVAITTASTSSGDAPLTVTFDGSQSSDPENGALSYLWNFGDSTPTSTAVNPTHIFSSPGTYSVQLTVTDPANLSASKALTITVAAPQRKIDVAAMSATGVKAKNGSNITASVTVKDGSGAAVSGATVTGTWKNGTKTLSTKTATTSTSGVATINSGNVRAASGAVITYCVTALTVTGGSWNTTLYSPTAATDCVTWQVP